MSEDNEVITLLYTQFANGQINGHQFASALAIERAKELDALTAENAALKAKLAQAREAMQKVDEYIGEIYESYRDSDMGAEYAATCHGIAEIASEELDDALQKLSE